LSYSQYSYPPLVHAAYKGQNAVVKLLLEAGADIECLDEVNYVHTFPTIYTTDLSIAAPLPRILVVT
jgi:hypothetical protein